jgi:hypothetical protein
MVLAVAALSSAFTLTPQSSSCDLKELVTAYYCKEDAALCGATQLVSNHVYYRCKECDSVEMDSGDCPDCEKPLTKTTSGKNVCPTCFKAPSKVTACRKVYFECPTCDHTSTKQDTCSDCEELTEKKVSLSLVRFVCPKCKHEASQQGTCPGKECKKAKSQLKAVCRMSGTFPHLGSKKK